MKKISAACITIMFLTVVVVLSSGREVTATHEYLVTKYYRFEEIDSDEIIQEFFPKYEKIDSIELFIANIYPETEGKISLTIIDENNKNIYSKKFKASSIPTGEFYRYKIGKKLEKDGYYRILLSYEGNSKELPQVMVSERGKNLMETGGMYIDGDENKYNLAITYHYSER